MDEAQTRQIAVDYESLLPELMGFATGLVGRLEAQDVVGDVLAQSLGTPTWSTVDNPRAYLFRAVFNEAGKRSRRTHRRTTLERLAAQTPALWVLPEFRPEVRAAVEALSVRQRAVIVLTYWDDLDPSAVGALLGISEGSVRKHLARARSRLREVLDER
jgi:RNA polymerase sigma-70 factor (ECF subfamily)